MMDEETVDAPAMKAVDPDDEALRPIQAALDGGDLREARRLAKALASDTSAGAGARRRAEGVLAQLAVDPVIVAVMLTTGLLIAILIGLYLHRY